ncbi:MAG: FAD-dependent oxidoreductase, partial [Gordonia sp. (in: high G+C Gram-positive bacteria)]
ARAYRRHHPVSAAYKVDYVLGGIRGGSTRLNPVGWTAPGCAAAGTVHVGGTVAEIAAAEREMLAGVMPPRPFVLVCQQAVADPSRSASQLWPLDAYAHVPVDHDGPVEPLITAQIERFAPGFTARIVSTRTTSPRELARHNANNAGGDIGGGPNDLARLVFRPRITRWPYATGVPGVFLCSAATPPGGGVHGMCGYHAAGAALRFLRQS